jgi:hypothetical protein
MIAAGARRFACGLSPAGNAQSRRLQSDGTVLVRNCRHVRRERL